MANPSVGSVTFLRMAGEDPLPPALAVEDITRAGIDGQAFRTVGKRAPVVTVTCEVDTAAPATLMASVLALRGTLVTVVNGDGNSYSNVMVLDVSKPVARPIKSAVGGLAGGSATHWFTCAFRLQNTTV